MSRDWWAGVLSGAMLAIVIATLYGIAVASRYPAGSFAFLCIRH